jgi:hypothetical protein
MSPVSFVSKGSYFYDWPNSLLLVIEPALFIYSNICGRFWGKKREFGRNRPEKKILDATVVVPHVPSLAILMFGMLES